MTRTGVAALQQLEAPSETDWLTVVFAGLALLVAAIAAVYAKRSVEQATRAADAAEKNLAAAERSAKAAEVSADTAKDSASASGISANAAADLLRVELDRQHNDYEPRRNGEWVFEPHARLPRHRFLVFRFKLDREYAVLATASADNGRTTTVCGVTAASQPDGWWRVHVEDWSESQQASAWSDLTLRFWPPSAREGRARPWNCLCGRQLDAVDGDDAAHWDFAVAVEPPEDSSVIVFR